MGRGPKDIHAHLIGDIGTFSKSGCEPVDSADTSLAQVGATFGPKLIIYTGLWATYWRFVDR